MDKRDFFTLLRRKLSRKPSAPFEKQFWRRFHEEFKSKEIRLSHTRSRWWRWAAVPAMAVLLILILKDNPWYRRQAVEQAAVQAEVPYEKLIEQAELLENLDLFLGPPEPMANLDYSELTDEEWKILLGENG